MTIHRIIAGVMLAALLCSPAAAQRHTERGALTGGLAGALIGAAIGENNGEGAEGALIGSAIGLFSGAAIGNSVDREEAQWRAARQYQQNVHRAQAVSMVDVVQMAQTGLSDSVIINQIRTRGVQRRPQVPDVIYLHQQGVSDSVITTMQSARLAGAPLVRPAPAPAPVVVERHHYVAPVPYWQPHYVPRYPYHAYHPRSGVRFGITLGR